MFSAIFEMVISTFTYTFILVFFKFNAFLYDCIIIKTLHKLSEELKIYIFLIYQFELMEINQSTFLK